MKPNVVDLKHFKLFRSINLNLKYHQDAKNIGIEQLRLWQRLNSFPFQNLISRKVTKKTKVKLKKFVESMREMGRRRRKWEWRRWGGGFLFNFIKKTTSLVVVSANVLYLHSNFSINSRKKLCLKIEESLISNGLLFYLENEYLMFLHPLPPFFKSQFFSPEVKYTFFRVLLAELRKTSECLG